MLPPPHHLLPLLRLHNHAHRLPLDPHDNRPADKQSLVYVRRSAERVVAAADQAGAVEADDGAGGRVGHVEGQAEGVAGCEEVGARV